MHEHLKLLYCDFLFFLVDSECTDLNEQLKKASTDKLRFLLECLLETLISTTNGSSAAPQLSVSLLTSLSPPTCEALFHRMCISGTKRIQILTGMLLVRVCGTQPWWGKFLGNILQRFFHSEYKEVFPQDRYALNKFFFSLSTTKMIFLLDRGSRSYSLSIEYKQ